MQFDQLKIELQGRVGVITVDNPPVNAFNSRTYHEVAAAFTDPESAVPGARAIVLTGNGKHFCGGSDIGEFDELTPETAAEISRYVRRAFFAIQECPLPVTAAVAGAAVGTGLAVAASCDVIVAAEDARFGLPEVSVGMMGGVSHLQRLVPPPLVRWMFLSADPVPVAELAPFGAVLEIVPREQLLAASLARAERMARHSPVTLAFAKRSLNQVAAMDVRPGYEFEQGLTGGLSGHPDAKEAVHAYMERRDPEYTGALEDLLGAGVLPSGVETALRDRLA